MTALISDAKYQSKLDEYWAEAVALGDENYFNQSLKLLNGLLVSGNMPNLAAAQSAPPASSSSTVPESSSSAVGPSSSSSILALRDGHVAAVPAFAVHGRTLQVNYAGFARVDLFSVTGAAVKTLWKGSVDGTVSVGLQGIPGGIYVVRMHTQNGSTMQKVRLE
jgi:hypothetical protein